MACIKINNFCGITPRMYPSMLSDGMAIKAHNCRLKSGKLVPIKQPLRVEEQIIFNNDLTSVGSAQSIYHWRRGSNWTCFMAWPGIVKIAPSNIASDSHYRIFVSGDTGVGEYGKEPCFFSQNTSDLGYTKRSLIKSPLGKPTVTVVGTPSESSTIYYSTWYQSWVDEYGYESPVSEGSDIVSYNDGQAVSISSTIAPDHAMARRFYKVIAGTSTETDGIQFVSEQMAVSGTFPTIAVCVRDALCAEAIPNIVSPAPDMRDMQYVSGSFYTAFSVSDPKTVMFSDINRPYSWPIAYRYDVRDNIVGLASVKNCVYVLTNGFPTLISGYSPDSMTVTDITARQACVSRRSIVVADGSVFYASQDGICQINPDTSYQLHVNVITDKYFTKQQWSALRPETCLMEEYDGAIYAWFRPTDSTTASYIIDLKEGSCAITTHDEFAKSAYYDCEDDSLYYVKEVAV